MLIIKLRFLVTAVCMRGVVPRLSRYLVILCEPEASMKTAIIVGVTAFILADTFFMWCLLRANTMYEQNEENSRRQDTEEEKKEFSKE